MSRVWHYESVWESFSVLTLSLRRMYEHYFVTSYLVWGIGPRLLLTKVAAGASLWCKEIHSSPDDPVISQWIQSVMELLPLASGSKTPLAKTPLWSSMDWDLEVPHYCFLNSPDYPDYVFTVQPPFLFVCLPCSCPCGDGIVVGLKRGFYSSIRFCF